MSEITAPIAQALHAILPGWVALPNMTFVLPHAIYWGGLIGFPLIAAYLVHRAEADKRGRPVSLPVAYMFLFSAGFLGLHRLYLKAPKLAILFIALFFLVLHGNDKGAIEREVISKSQNDLKIASSDVRYYTKRAGQGRKGAQAKLEKARVMKGQAGAELAQAKLQRARWNSFAGFCTYLIFVLLLLDAYLMPRLFRRCLEREPVVVKKDFQVMERGPKPDPRRDIHTPLTKIIDRINGMAGIFVAYWAVIAVFIYYYEVLARYVFNSPTNWAHEGMFLMFGMQYLLAGGYAMREESHVRVDVLYEMRSFRTKAIIDVVTSVFFFIFVLTLLGTGLIFAMDSIEVQETTLNEWGIQYWPVKLAIPIGAFLLLLQGIAKLIRDILYLRGVRGPTEA